LGYRAPEFDHVDWANSIVIFGCSNLFGDGVDDSETMPAYLSEIVGMPVINMGAGASSQEFALHNNVILKEHYATPRAVINYWTSVYRHMVYNMGPMTAKVSSHNYEDCAGNWFQEGNPETRTYFNQLLARNIWKDATVYYSATWCEDTSSITGCDLIRGSDRSRAREMRHPGPQDNRMIAEYMARRLREQGLKF
jgi:hypothetical protein